MSNLEFKANHWTLVPFNLSLKRHKEYFPLHLINIYYFKAAEVIISWPIIPQLNVLIEVINDSLRTHLKWCLNGSLKIHKEYFPLPLINISYFKATEMIISWPIIPQLNVLKEVINDSLRAHLKWWLNGSLISLLAILKG